MNTDTSLVFESWSTNKIEILQKELADLPASEHPGHELFYEYHSNESQAADHILFHALGGGASCPYFL